MQIANATSAPAPAAIHARHVASKIAADLKRIQRFFGMGVPTDEKIADFQAEAALLLANAYLKEVTYGFIGNASGKWVYAAKYEDIYGQVSRDSRGGVFSGDAGNSHFGSFLVYSQKWAELSPSDRQKFNKKLPIRRVLGVEPNIDIGGAWVYDRRKYASGKIGVERAMIDYN